MKILIVEDDQNKLNQLEEYIEASFVDCSTTSRRSYQSGLKEIVKENYDLIILDMSMPTFDVSPHNKEGRLRTYGGEEIITQMKARKIPTPVIVVTQFETFGEGKNVTSLKELMGRLETNYSHIYKGTVYYNPALNSWRDDLLFSLNKLVRKIFKDS